MVRASKGTLFCVPVASAPVDAVWRFLDHAGLRLVVATPDAPRLFTEVDLTGPTAIAVGAERPGLSAGWLSRAHASVRVPMVGRGDSLNVATCAALVVYEALRQRQAAASLR